MVLNLLGGGVLCKKYMITNQAGETLDSLSANLGVPKHILQEINNLTTAGPFPQGTDIYYPAD